MSSYALKLVVHDIGRPDKNEILYTAQRAEFASKDGVFFHPVDRTVLSITEIYHKSEIHVANTTVLEDMQAFNYIHIFIDISKYIHTYFLRYFCGSPYF
jgi:hypothetical protein